MEEIVLSGIPISITKKSIKNMYIRVLPPDGRVQITAPHTANDDSIRRFAISRISWIKKQKKSFEEQPRQTKRQYITGESYYLWGKRYRLDVQYSNVKNCVCLSGGKLILQVRKESTAAQRENVLNEWYREQIKQTVPGVLQKCENIAGVQAEEWHIKNMRTKWGICNIEKRRIWLNLQLAKKTPECLEYVIIHELVHFLERNHNERFCEYMNHFCPNWREIKENLNQQMLDHFSGNEENSHEPAL